MVKAIVRVVVAIVAAVMLWRFGVEIEEDNLAPAIEMVVTLVIGWVAIPRPGDVSRKAADEAARDAVDRASRIPRPPVYILVFALLTPMLTACGHLSTEDVFRGSLVALEKAADPTYELLMKGCDATERAIIQRVQTEGYKPAYGDAFEDISQTCHEAREVFSAVRSAHDKAASFVESGKLSKLLPKGGGS